MPPRRQLKMVSFNLCRVSVSIQLESCASRSSAFANCAPRLEQQLATQLLSVFSDQMCACRIREVRYNGIAGEEPPPSCQSLRNHIPASNNIEAIKYVPIDHCFDSLCIWVYGAPLDSGLGIDELELHRQWRCAPPNYNNHKQASHPGF